MLLGLLKDLEQRPEFYAGCGVLTPAELDREPIHDWRELQDVKNALVGTEGEAVELYPAESRLVDTANQYHLFALAERGQRFPFGFRERLVGDKSVGASRQRPRAGKE